MIRTAGEARLRQLLCLYSADGVTGVPDMEQKIPRRVAYTKR